MFSAQYLKKDRKKSCYEHVGAEYHKRHGSSFLAPQGYDEHPLVLFVWESHPGMRPLTKAKELPDR